MPLTWKIANVNAVRVKLTPPTRPEVPCPNRSNVAAMCVATREEEHAVSTLKLAPLNPNMYEMRPQATLSAPCNDV